MLVFWKQRIVFLAVPKTGTTALEAALAPHASSAILDPPGQKHVSARRYRNMLAGFFESRGRHPMETVAVMREPVGWLHSWYRYRQRPFLAGKPASTRDIGFDDFVAAWLRPERPALADVGSQARFLTDAQGRLAVDRLFRHDRMAEVTAFFEDRLGVGLDLPRLNVSPARDLLLSPEMDKRLRAEAAPEFALWDRLCAG